MITSLQTRQRSQTTTLLISLTAVLQNNCTVTTLHNFTPKYYAAIMLMHMCVLRSPGYQSALPLLRPLGRQPLHGGRAADPHLPAVPHVRPLHTLRVHPRPGLLRSPGRLPRSLPPGGQGARQVRQSRVLIGPHSEGTAVIG